jgi:Tfp pilus assembly major pilin PilA
MYGDDGSGWVCGFCGQPVDKFRTGEMAREVYTAVMAWHAVNDHQINMGDLDQARRWDKTWVLPDGQVWLRRER